MSAKVPAAILREAADIVEKGWTQHSYCKDGLLCADGAIHVAAGTSVVRDGRFENADPEQQVWNAYGEAYQAACRAAEKAGYLHQSIIGYNDEDGRTADEVAAVLRAAAEDVA